MHRTTERFRALRDTLPPDAQEHANKAFALLKLNPRHPSLHFKKVGPFWSARIGRVYRALAVEDAEDFVWVWIGTRDEYEGLLRHRP